MRPLATIGSLLPGLLADRLRRGSPPPTDWAVRPLEVAALQMDVSGFSSLVEQLAGEGPAGAEDVVAMLDRYFSAIVNAILANGGHPVSFAGDAVIAAWPASAADPLQDQVLRAAAAGLAAQQACQEVAEASGQLLTFRIGIGAGEAQEMDLGGHEGKWLFCLAGPAMVDMGSALVVARPGDTTLSPAAVAMAGNAARLQSRVGGTACVLEVDAPLPDEHPPVHLDQDAADAASHYLPAAVLDLLSAGPLELHAEHRQTTAVLINLPRLDTSERASQARLQEVAVGIQAELGRFDGMLPGLVADEKGVTFVAGFGLPPLHSGENAVKAVATASRIHETLLELKVEHGIGVATGRTFFSAYGSDGFRQFTFIGSSVNLAARLMQGGANEVLCDSATARAAQRRFRFSRLRPLHVKGRDEPVEVFRPTWGEELGLAGRPPRPLVGRDPERLVLAARLGAMATSAKGVIVIEGDAGIGKTSLATEVLEVARSLGIATLVTAADPVGASPYQAWRPIVQEALGFDQTFNRDARTERLRRALVAEAGVDSAEAANLAPLLNPMTALALPETEVTLKMAPEGRRERTSELLLRILRWRSRGEPLLLVIDDVQWLDDASWKLLERAYADVDTLALLLIGRPFPAEPDSVYRRLLEREETYLVPLEVLDASATRRLAADALGVGSLPDPIAAFIGTRSEGHPLLTEELAFHLRDEGYIRIEQGVASLTVPPERLEALELPATVHDIIVSRLARLDALQQMTLKAASVAGGTFDPDLIAVIHPLGLGAREVEEHLRLLADLDLIRETEEGFRFKHLVTQESVYEELPRTIRRELHEKLAVHMEGDREASRQFSLLAHHWEAAQRYERAVDLWEAAAAEALVRGANRDALRFYFQCLRLGTGDRAALPVAPPRHAFWLGEAAEAYGGLGDVASQIEYQTRALSVLGVEMPATRLGEMLRLVKGVLVQIWHLLWRRQRPLSPGVDHQAAFEEAKLTPSYYYRGEVVRMATVSLDAINRAERAGDPALAGLAYVGLGTLVGVLRMRRLAHRYFELARRPLLRSPVEGVTGEPAAELVPDFVELNRVGADLAEAIVELQAGDVGLDRILALLSGALRRAEELEAHQYVGALLAARGLVHSIYSHSTLALADLEALGEVARRHDQPQHETWSLALQIPVHIERGDADAALASGEAADLVAPRADEISQPLYLAGRAGSLAAAGRSAAAEEAFAEASGRLSIAPVFLYLVAYSTLLHAGLVLTGNEEPGKGWWRALRRFDLYALLLPFARGRARYYRGMGRERAGKQGAIRSYRAALASFEKAGHRRDLARCHARLARLASLTEAERVEHRRRCEEVQAAIGEHVADLDAPPSG